MILTLLQIYGVLFLLNLIALAGIKREGTDYWLKDYLDKYHIPRIVSFILPLWLLLTVIVGFAGAVGMILIVCVPIFLLFLLSHLISSLF